MIRFEAVFLCLGTRFRGLLFTLEYQHAVGLSHPFTATDCISSHRLATSVLAASLTNRRVRQTLFRLLTKPAAGQVMS